MNKVNIKKAIAQGKEMIKSGMSKAVVESMLLDITDMWKFMALTSVASTGNAFIWAFIPLTSFAGSII